MAQLLPRRPVSTWILLCLAGCAPGHDAEESPLIGAQGSGQTGSPTCSLSLSCTCAALDGRVLVTGTVEEAAPNRTKLRVESVITLGPLSQLPSAALLRPGDTLIGYDDDPPEQCEGAAPGSAAIAGAQVFAAYQPAQVQVEDFADCPARPACEGSSCANDAAGNEVCPGRTLAFETGRLWTTPLEDSVAVQEDLALAIDELAPLTHVDVCSRRFPGPSTGCQDTRFVSVADEGDGCTLSGGARGARSCAWYAAAALVWAALSRRRRVR